MSSGCLKVELKLEMLDDLVTRLQEGKPAIDGNN